MSVITGDDVTKSPLSQVRMEVTKLIGRWLHDLPDRYSFFYKFIPLMLTSFDDDFEEIRFVPILCILKITLFVIICSVIDRRGDLCTQLQASKLTFLE